MSYSEDKDLIQNMKDLEEQIHGVLSKFSEVEPSIDEILGLKDQFENLKSTTLSIINQYDDTLDHKTQEMNDLLENCRSQFKQVTNDIESLVNLQVNFTDIEDKINRCLSLSSDVANIVSGPFIMMDGPDNYVEPANRLPYKYYLNVISST